MALPSQQTASPHDPSLLPVVHGFHSDVPPTEGEEQALHPPLSLQHQALVRRHGHFLPESCDLENKTRGIPGFSQPSQTGFQHPGHRGRFRVTRATVGGLTEPSIAMRLEATCSRCFPSQGTFQDTSQKRPFQKILTQCFLLVCQETLPTGVQNKHAGLQFPYWVKHASTNLSLPRVGIA